MYRKPTHEALLVCIEIGDYVPKVYTYCIKYASNNNCYVYSPLLFSIPYCIQTLSLQIMYFMTTVKHEISQYKSDNINTEMPKYIKTNSSIFISYICTEQKDVCIAYNIVKSTKTKEYYDLIRDIPGNVS